MPLPDLPVNDAPAPDRERSSAIERVVVRQAGGSLTVDSEPGTGSVFEVLLPILEADTGVAEAAPAPAAADYGGTETILVVEDDPGVRSLMTRMLGRLGYDVIAARDGQEAFAVLQSIGKPIDLLICDVVMPDISGTEVVNYFHAKSPRTRAVFMSGHTTVSLLQDGRLVGSDEFIHKPFTQLALARKTREVLDA